MAARRTFRIVSSLGEETAHTFNAAVRRTEQMMRAHVKRTGRIFWLTSRTMEKADGFHASSGTRVWAGSDGSTITFSISELPDER